MIRVASRWMEPMEREIDVQPHALRGRVQSSRQQIFIMRPRHIATDGLVWSVCYCVGRHEREQGRIWGGGKLGSCPGATTTKGPPQKNSKKLLPKER